MTVRVAMFGTSWWADAMYLPILASRDDVEVVAVAGRDKARTRSFADRWGVGAAYQEADRLLAEQGPDAVLLATPNNTHRPLALAAIAHGAGVLCEKPLGLNYAEASEMADRAEEAGLITMVPFTYRFMPTTRYLHDLVASGYLGTPYHLNLRYYSGWARDGSYNWRFNVAEAGPGILGDLGAHFLYLARWFFGEVVDVSAMLGWMSERPRPDLAPYEQGDDVAQVMLRFANGAVGSVTASGMALEPNEFGQRHEMELHGSDGTLRHLVDWEGRQTVSGTRRGESSERVLDVPEAVWGGAPRQSVVDTYRHVFRQQGLMVGEFVDGVASQQSVSPDFRDGAAVQAIIDAAWRSHHERRWVAIDEITGATS